MQKNGLPSTSKWRLHQEGIIKINIDASLDEKTQRAFISYIARDHTGTVLAFIIYIARDHTGTVLDFVNKEIRYCSSLFAKVEAIYIAID